MPSAPRTLVSLLALTLVLAVGSAAQSASDILNRTLEAYEHRMEGIDNYTLVQDVMGMESVMYFEKEVAGGRPVVHLKHMTVAGRSMNTTDDTEKGWDQFYAMVPEFVSHAHYLGRDEVQGFPVHVVEVRDLHELDFIDVPQPEDVDFRWDTAKLFIDSDQWVVRRAEIAGQVTTNGQTHDVTSVTDLKDYRDVHGLLHPFLVTVQMQGLGAAMGMSDADMAEARKQLDEMKKQMAQMPEAQRAMMEQMLRQQTAAMEQMLGGGGGNGMTVEMRVKRLDVNTGPPGGN